MFNNKVILVTGGTGMIGIQLTKYLLEYGANVTIVSLDSGIKFKKKVKFIKTDLRNISNCLNVCKNIDYVFNLACNMGGMGFIENNKALCMLSAVININLLNSGHIWGININSV